MNFYTEKKEYISPSALATWFGSKVSFIDSYFKGEKTEDTASMKAGTMLHALIESGLYTPQKRYQSNECKLSHLVGETGVKSFGKPDSFSLIKEGLAEFVDYKTGREVSWSREDLKLDVKMRQTAWLVWKETGMPDKVNGFIEWIGTEWNGQEIVPSEDEYMLIKCEYTAQELNEWEKVVEKAINDINIAYERFLTSTEVFVDEEVVKEYVKLEQEIKAKEAEIDAIEARQEELGKVISDQLSFGNAENHKTVYGNFSWRTTKTYQYPEDLTFQIGSTQYSQDFAKQVAVSYKSAVKTFEMLNEPIDISKKLQFRLKK